MPIIENFACNCDYNTNGMRTYANNFKYDRYIVESYDKSQYNMFFHPERNVESFQPTISVGPPTVPPISPAHNNNNKPNSNPENSSNLVLSQFYTSVGGNNNNTYSDFVNNPYNLPTSNVIVDVSPPTNWNGPINDLNQVVSFGNQITRCGYSQIEGLYVSGWVWMPEGQTTVDIEIVSVDISYIYINGSLVTRIGTNRKYKNFTINGFKGNSWNLFEMVGASGCAYGRAGFRNMRLTENAYAQPEGECKMSSTYLGVKAQWGGWCPSKKQREKKAYPYTGNGTRYPPYQFINSGGIGFRTMTAEYLKDNKDLFETDLNDNQWKQMIEFVLLRGGKKHSGYQSPGLYFDNSLEPITKSNINSNPNRRDGKRRILNRIIVGMPLTINSKQELKNSRLKFNTNYTQDQWDNLVDANFDTAVSVDRYIPPWGRGDPLLKYSCNQTTGKCEKDPNGKYTSLEDCNKNCKPSQPGPSQPGGTVIFNKIMFPNAGNGGLMFDLLTTQEFRLKAPYQKNTGEIGGGNVGPWADWRIGSAFGPGNDGLAWEKTCLAKGEVGYNKQGAHWSVNEDPSAYNVRGNKVCDYGSNCYSDGRNPNYISEVNCGQYSNMNDCVTKPASWAGRDPCIWVPKK